MAKTKEEIKELLATPLFVEGQKSNYISILEKGDTTYIEYHCKNGAKRKLQNPEEFVQATAFLRLIIEYNYSPLTISVNEEVQVGSSRKEADILVYNDNKNKILIVVECKEEQINERQFQVAIDQAYVYAHALAGQYVWVTSGIRNEYFEIVELYPVERISISEIPKKDGKVDRYKYTKGGREPQPGTKAELMQKFKSAHDALWGGGALAPTTAFDELDKLIFCKIWDEKWKENDPKSKGEPFAFQLISYPEDYDDKHNIKAKTELEKRVRQLYEQGRKKDPEVFKDDIKLDKHKIYTVVQYLQDINLSQTDLDSKGLAFQRFMGEFFRGDFGQFFTPDSIVDFIVKSIGINKDWKILDTSCGSGGFLLHALKEVRDEADNIYDDEIGSASWKSYWHEFAEKHLYGIEINEQISRVAKMNMIIHDDGHTNIITNDGLKNNKAIEIENRNLNFQDGTFDLIMTNPPFGSSVKADEVGYYKEYELFEKNLGITEIKDRIIDNDNKNKWRTSQSTEVLFLERCYKYLNEENGYLAIVIPDGILTNSTSQYVRDWIVEHFRIIAVVSLPQHTFSHVKAGVKSSVLFLKKHPHKLTERFEQSLSEIKAKVRKEKGLDKDQRAERMLELYKELIFKYFTDDEVLMLEIENVGYDATGKPIEGNELILMANEIKSFIGGRIYKAKDKRCFTLDVASIIGNRFDVQFHAGIKHLLETIKTIPHKSLGEIAEFSSEGWDQKAFFIDTFPYIEISSIDTITGKINDIEPVPLKEAPSRAKKIVRKNDILVSMTRPSRGAITIYDKNDVAIASTGFSIIRGIDQCILREYLYIVLRMQLSLEQMALRSSGGNYPAIIESELKKVIVPIPPLETQKNIIETVSKMNNKAEQLKKESDALLYKAKQKAEKMIIG
ncbi:MAG: N-6 DNA methylase [Bacteroidaceae bacterium]|nr:N-6 DNA methylase [Bacteroidaceae bacterium]